MMIGGEGEENPIWMTHGTWISFAQRFVKINCFNDFKFLCKTNLILKSNRTPCVYY